MTGVGGVLAVVLAQLVAGGLTLTWCSPLWNEAKRSYFTIYSGVLLGVFARLGAAAIAVFLVAAAFMVHKFWLVTDPVQAQNQLIHFMKNLSMAGGALFIVYFGSGPFSLRSRKREEGLGGGRLGMPLRH